MRISERTYPLLKFLQDTDAEIGLRIPPEEEASGRAWRIFMEFFKDSGKPTIYAEHIDIVSQPFMEAALANREKILTEETLRELLKEPIYGTLIAGGFIICYYFCHTENGMVGHRALTCYRDLFISTTTGDNQYLVPRDYEKAIGRKIDAQEYDCWPLIFHLFKKYADVETVEAKKNKKVRLPDGDKLLVESSIPMTYTDCSWFREIIRREEFMVRGHFRLQPYKKDGEWTKKLIYIEPFQKHGYTRRAKIEHTSKV